MSLKHVNNRSATVAGIAGVIAMIIIYAIFGMNSLWMMGSMTGAVGAGAYVVGAVFHLIIGVIYAFIYAIFVEKWLRSLPRWLAGATYSLFPFLVAVLFLVPAVKGRMMDRMSDEDESERVCRDDEEGCESGCDMHKKMPYNPPRERNGGYVMRHCEGGNCVPVCLAGCVGCFLAHLGYGVVLGMMYRPRARAK